MTEHGEVTVGAQGCNAQSSWNGNHEIKYCARPVGHPGEHRSSLVSEWDTLKWRDDDDPVPASQSVPAVPVSSTGGKEAGEAAETATEALRALVGNRMRGVLDGDEIDDLVDALAGWRPPLPDSETETCPDGECNQGMCGGMSDSSGPCGGCCGCLGGCLDARGEVTS